MKLSKISITLFGAALLFAATAFAGDTNKGTLNVSDKVTVEGKTLNPGTYKVEWEGTGPTVQVTVRKGKDTVATFPAHVTEGPNKNSADAYGSTAGPDGSRSLTAIYIGGKNTVLEVAQSSASTQSNTQDSK
jgi:hypothetical protein